ncbi:hypothetical protein [uncultured Methylophaga sp.]|uniref:hypothetical protein n=1 Tax=uncultured Methylophaga sp. TaxID=285271 RepID=UPI00260F8F32|nr:hypothetical protein [uncultured Methylophaga sp.]
MLLKYLKKLKEFVSFKEWLDDRRFAKRSGLRAAAIRVMRIFNAHQIPVTRIPQIFPEFKFKFSDFDSLDSLINVLTPELLDRLAEHFFISREWLDTGYGGIQERYEYGYNFRSLYNLITGDRAQENDATMLIAHFVVEDGVQFVPVADHDTYGGLMIILQHMTTPRDGDEFTYSRYQPLYFGYWHYYKTRMMIKALSLLFIQSPRIFSQQGVFIKQLKEGELHTSFAVEILNNTVSGWWYPEDYIFCNGQSTQEKDPVDAKQMHEFLKHKHLYEKIQKLSASEFLD